jgi:oligoribonuclease
MPWCRACARPFAVAPSDVSSLGEIPTMDPTLPTSPTSDNLVWIDLEMTGLDPGVDVILQAALVVTSGELQPLAEAAVDIHQPDDALSRMTPFVRDMHTRTGLVERVRLSNTTLADAERTLCEVVQRWCVSPAVLCGNSVWADRRFIARYMPGLDALLHYRIVDVSSIKVLAQRWYGASAVFAKPTTGAHDAVIDVRNSIAELRHYRSTLFQPSLPGEP